MACQIGITTDPARRKQEWQTKYPRLSGWTVLETHRTKTAAQAAETRLARVHGCNHGAGGSGPEVATWSVYRFNY